MGLAYRGVGKYDEAIAISNDLLDRAKKEEFNIYIAHQYFTLTYAMQGNMAKARYHAAELLKANPNYSVEYYRTTTFFKNPKHLELCVDALRKARIPDTPPEKSLL
jgi:tetratricopeptide (TPR) repeat protein